MFYNMEYKVFGNFEGKYMIGLKCSFYELSNYIGHLDFLEYHHIYFEILFDFLLCCNLVFVYICLLGSV